MVVPQSLFITQSYGRSRGQGGHTRVKNAKHESHENCTGTVQYSYSTVPVYRSNQDVKSHVHVKLPSRQSRCQVKSSQVKFKMAVANPPPLVPLAGASDREGRTRRNRHHWIAPSRGIIPMFVLMFLIIAARAPGLQHCTFFRKSTVHVYGNAKPIQTDDGSGRGPAVALCVDVEFF